MESATTVLTALLLTSLAALHATEKPTPGGSGRPATATLGDSTSAARKMFLSGVQVHRPVLHRIA
ncbi:MAG: hypothetical protein WCJ35_08160 [Planctomycetota bacterium]